MGDFLGGLTYPVAFIIALSVLIFVHELGHYLVARWCGVKIETFSIGFGRELFGWSDRHGTRWRVALIPLGGYVKMYGDANVASAGPGVATEMTAEERAQSFHHKTVSQRSAIVLAGPMANFLFAAVIYALLFVSIGRPDPTVVIGSVVENSAADEAGLRPGDIIRSIDGTPIRSFGVLLSTVRDSEGRPLRIEVERDGQRVVVTAAPRRETTEAGTQGPLRLGLSPVPGALPVERLWPHEAMLAGVVDTVRLSGAMLTAIGDMFTQGEGLEEIGGVLSIAKFSGDAAAAGGVAFVMFLAALSINLGLINLFPIPLLDGGHLVFYAIEAVRGRPLGERAQEYGLRIGLALVLTLFVFATWNDLARLQVLQFVRDLVPL